MIVLLLACAPEEEPVDPGFVVVGVSPEDGADDVVVAHTPELRFSSEVDTEACDASQLRLDAIHDDGTVAFPVEVTLTAADGAAKVQFVHEAALPRGWAYAVTVRGGADGCQDVAGDEILPFASSFYVP